MCICTEKQTCLGIGTPTSVHCASIMRYTKTGNSYRVHNKEGRLGYGDMEGGVAWGGGGVQGGA